jgi:hypothetical protein
MSIRALFAIVALAGGCAAAHHERSVSAGPAAALAVGDHASDVEVGSVASANAVAPPSPPPPAVADPPVLEVSTTQELTLAVSSIALGEGSRIAILSDPPQVGDAHGVHRVPLPNAFRAKPGENDDLRIFFGRDNEPRVMGTRRSSAGEASIYWRHTSSGWHDGREEIGQLGSTTRGGLWGVLGSADPELMCRASSVCIIKRSSGWTIAPAGPAPRVVTLQAGFLWGLDANGIASIDAHGWSVVLPAPAWSEPRAFWAVSGEAWVATARAFYHYHARVWSEERAPISEPTAFWGARPDSIWMAGKGGAAHFDGQSWRPLSIAGPLRAVAGRNDSELWFGGDAGLFRVQR